MKQPTLFILYIFIISSVVGLFSGDIENQHENPETYGELLKLLLELGKFNIPISPNASVVSDNQTNNFFFSINIYNSSKSNGFDSPGVRKGLDDQCLYNKDCRDVPYSVCSLEKCSCKHNYFAKDRKCLGLVEESCEEDSDCGVGSSTCQSGLCACRTGYYSANHDKCFRFAKEPGDFCEDNQGCLEVKHSTCFDNSCECKNDYRRQENLCLGLINAWCSSDQECAVNNSTCFFNSCQCPSGFYLNEDTCYEYAESLNEVCQSDEGCKHLPYTSCTNGHCLCLPNYDGSSGRCLGMINATCNDSNDCLTDNAVCDGTCQCPYNHYFEDNHCYKFADRLYRPAHSAEACRHFSNAIFARNQCECSLGYYYDNNHCYPIPSDYETPVDTAQACVYLPDAYYADGKCYSSMQGLHDPCRHNRACKVPFSECSNGKCECNKDYLEHDQVCYGLKNAKCNLSKDCALIWFLCESGTCQEKWDSTGNKLIAKKPGATTRWERYYPNVRGGGIFYNSTTNDVLLTITGNLAWEETYTLDKVAAYSDATQSSITVDCSVKTDDGKTVKGKIKFPGGKFCTDSDSGKILSFGSYSLLIDHGDF